MNEWRSVARDADLVEGDMLLYEQGDILIGIARANSAVYAFDDTCTHEECSLTEGRLDEDEVVCQCHGSVFNITTGEVLLGPATEPIRTYPVQVQDGEIRVQV